MKNRKRHNRAWNNLIFSNLEKKEKTRMVQDGNWLGREENHRTDFFMETKEKERFI